MHLQINKTLGYQQESTLLMRPLRPLLLLAARQRRRPTLQPQGRSRAAGRSARQAQRTRARRLLHPLLRLQQQQ